MKRIKIFALAAAALIVGLTSCNKENNTIEIPQEASPAVIKISFEQAKPETRAFDDDGTVPVSVEDAMLFILGSLNEVIGDPVYIVNPAVGSPVGEYSTTTNASKLVMVGNLGVEANYAELKAARSLSALQSVISELTDSFAATPLWVSGEGIISAFYPTGDPVKLIATGTVILRIVPVRIDIQVKNQMTNREDPKAIVLDDVSVLYSAGYSYLVPKNDSYTPFESVVVFPKLYYRSGLTNWPSQAINNSHAAFLSTPWAEAVMPVTEEFLKSFYALPGDTKNTIITIRGTMPAGSENAGAVVYFPVHFDGTKAAKLANGNLYKVVVNLKGDALQGGGGTSDPEVTVNDSYIEVFVTSAIWNIVSGSEIDFQ